PHGGEGVVPGPICTASSMIRTPGGIFLLMGLLRTFSTRWSDFDTTHPEQHEKEATSFIAKCTVTREVPCVSRHPGIPPPLSMRRSRRTSRTYRMETTKEEEAV